MIAIIYSIRDAIKMRGSEVGIELRLLDVGMPQDLPDGVDGDAGHDQVAGNGVSHPMQAKWLYTSPPEERGWTIYRHGTNRKETIELLRLFEAKPDLTT